jgi:methionyl-tRNA formyltransferase
MNILFCGYRPWARASLDKLTQILNFHTFHQVTSPEEMMLAVDTKKWDLILTAGWSWKIPNEVLVDNFVAGVHPSKLPAYAGGSPIQNQILDGIENSEACLFKFTEKFDEGPILGRTPLSLRGHMSDIFEDLTVATVKLMNEFIMSYPHHSEVLQTHSEGFVRRRIKPEQSRLTPEILRSMTCKQLYDFIRCHEDPYPNVYIEDATGRLSIKLAEFEPKTK